MKRKVMTQFPCEALRIAAEPLLVEFNRGGKLQELLLRYSHVLKTQLVQARKPESTLLRFSDDYYNETITTG